MYDDYEEFESSVTMADVAAYMHQTGQDNTRRIWDPYCGEYVEVPVANLEFDD